jgi:hypothetical protein
MISFNRAPEILRMFKGIKKYPPKMKKITQIPAILTAGLMLLASCAKENKVELFNGKNPDNMEIVLLDSIAEPGDVFMVRDGVMRVAGQPYGYIVTRDSYSNYKLHVEWRWPEKPANSGVFIHVQGINPTGWPACIEAQLAADNAGQMIFVGQGTGMHVGDSTYLTQPGMTRSSRVGKLEESSENPAGEWNSYDITCRDGSIELLVNGVLQNQGTECTLKSGRIALQSEGGPIEFRNVYLELLK